MLQKLSFIFIDLLSVCFRVAANGLQYGMKRIAGDSLSTRDEAKTCENRSN
jgi:hypothetical protein